MNGLRSPQFVEALQRRWGRRSPAAPSPESRPRHGPGMTVSCSAPAFRRTPRRMAGDSAAGPTRRVPSPPNGRPSSTRPTMATRARVIVTTDGTIATPWPAAASATMDCGDRDSRITLRSTLRAWQAPSNSCRVWVAFLTAGVAHERHNQMLSRYRVCGVVVRREDEDSRSRWRPRRTATLDACCV